MRGFCMRWPGCAARTTSPSVPGVTSSAPAVFTSVTLYDGLQPTDALETISGCIERIQGRRPRTDFSRTDETGRDFGRNDRHPGTTAEGTPSMDTSEPPPGSVVAYARALTGQLMVAPDGVLQAAYLHGSAALGGWVPGRSDVDMLFLAADGISSAAVTRMGEVLRAGADGCPGRELECSVVTVAQARQPAPPWPFVLHVTAGPGKPGRTVRPDGW